jgi:hypothetical protein
MATLNIENKVASLQEEKIILEAKIADFEFKINDIAIKLE